MNYSEKTKDELIRELIAVKAENERLSSSTKGTFDYNENIRLSELRYERFFEDNHSVMLLVQPETGEIRDANPTACSYYGWSRVEMQKMNIAEINTLSPTEIKVEMQKSINDKRRQFNFRHRLSNGEIRDVEVFSGPINFDNTTYLYSIVHDVTERRQVENALILSEEKYAKAFLSATYAVMITRIESGEFIEVNDAFCLITGYTKEEVLTNTSETLNLWVDVTDRGKVIKALSETGQFSEMEFAFRRKDGEVIIGSMSSSVININNEKCIFSSINDITQRKYAEQKLKISEERYRNIFETVQDAYYEASPDGILLDISPSIEAISKGQFIREDLIGKSFVGLYDDPEARGQSYAQLLSHGKLIDYELSLVNKDGTVIPVAISSAVIKDASGNPVKITGSMRDISKRKKAENALLESELQYHELADSGQALIWTATPDKKCDYFNQVWLKFTGRTLEQELGDGWAESVHPDDLNTCFEIYTQAFDKREEFSMTYRMRRFDSEYRWILDEGKPRYNTHGEFIGYIGNCLDISDIIIAEQEIKKSEEKYRKDLLLLNSIFESPVNIIVFSLDNNYCYSAFTKYHAQTMKVIWGVDIDMGMNMLDIISKKEDREKAKQNFDRVLKDDFFVLTEEYGDDALYRTYYENFYSPVKNSLGEIIGLSVFVIDVTERMQATKTLEISEERFRKVVEQTSDLVAITDVNGFITYASSSSSMFQLSAEEMLGRHFIQFVAESDLESSANGFKGMLETGAVIKNSVLLLLRLLLTCINFKIN